MTALGLPYPTIIGTVAAGEWASTVMGVVAEGRYGVRLGQTWSEAEIDLRACLAWAATAERELGRRPDLLGAPYGADMRLRANDGGTPTVMFGMLTAHAADEDVRLDEVVATSQVLVTWVEGAIGGGA